MNSVKKVTTMAAGTKKQSFSHGDSGAVGYGSKTSDSFALHNPKVQAAQRNADISNKVKFNNSADNVGPSSNNQYIHSKVADMVQKFSPFDRSIASSTSSSVARKVNPSPGVLPTRATYSAQNVPRNVPHEVLQSDKRLYQPYIPPPQQQHSSMLGNDVPNTSGSYDNRRNFTSSHRPDDLKFTGASHDSTILSPRGAIRRSNDSPYQSNEFLNSIILGDEGHSNYYLNELRDESLEVYPIDAYKERDILSSNKKGMSGSDPNLLPFGTLSSFQRDDYGNSKYLRGDDEGFLANRRSLNNDHNGNNGSGSGSRNASLNINSLFSHDLDGSGKSNSLKGYKSFFDSSLL